MNRGAWYQVILAAVLCGLLASCSPPISVREVDGGRYGKVKVLEPPHPRGFVIYFSAGTGADDAAARTVAQSGALVVEVNTPEYLKRLDSDQEKCHYLTDDAEALSHQLERSLGFSRYLSPTMAGRGEGGTLAELTLADAPAVTIAGAVSIDPASVLPTATQVCSDAPVKSVANGFSYAGVKSLPGFWDVGLTPATSQASRDWTEAMRRADPMVEIHDFTKSEPAGAMLASMMAPRWAAAKPAGDVSNIPLVELPVNHRSKLMAIVLSGDGGWRDLDKTIAIDLQRQGVPVVGWDSLRYFWNRKTPQQAAADLGAVIDAYTVKWHADKVALIGYSFGADVIPFAYDRLPPGARSHVALVALLGFAKSADFEIRVGGWLGLPPSPTALPVLPATAKIPPRLMQCFYGADEGDSACPELARRGVEVIRTPGGHHFNGDYAALERDILSAFEQRAGQLTLRPRAKRVKHEG